METKFTKGEWKLCIYDSGCEYGREPRNWVVSKLPLGKELTISKTFCVGDIEEERANAKLIAAAPDMLDALLDIYEDREAWSDISPSQRDKIEKAIKKAINFERF